MTNKEIQSTIHLLKKFQSLDTYRMGLCIQALELQQKLTEWIDSYKADTFEDVSWNREELLSILEEFVVMGEDSPILLPDEVPTIQSGMIIHCDTETKAKTLLQIARNQGWEWRNSSAPELHYDTFEENTCYSFTDKFAPTGKKIIEFGPKPLYEEIMKFTEIISFDDFIQTSIEKKPEPITM